MRIRLSASRALARMLAIAVTAASGLVLVSSVASTPAQASTVRERMVDIAEREKNDGSRNAERGGDNCNFYSGQMGSGDPCGIPGWRSTAWCAHFVKYVWREAGGVEAVETIGDRVINFVEYGQRHGTWHPIGSGYSPRPGDAAIYPDEPDDPDPFPPHMGMVLSNSGGVVTTVEGNVSDRIALRTNPRLMGYVSPAIPDDKTTIPDVSGDGYADILAAKSDGSLNYFANNFNVSPNAPYGNSRQIGSGWADMKHTALGDVNGDGYADILAAKPDGTLRYYGNNFNASPTAPYGSGYQIGSGWADMKHFAAADVNGDGYADILAVDQAGNLRYYGNNFKVSSNAPYGNGYQIGSGWADMKHFAAADVNGDGYADILAVDQAGNLRYYGNNFKVSSNAPYGNGYQIGSGWADMKHFAAADVNGDTFADILAAKPDGTLRYYGNNFKVSPNAPYGNGYQIGSGWNTVTHIL
ncbi:VCBS repeat-containing protein [Nonomuraea sp. NPDC046802]|uniref:FG-GAP repeat domain-containing protein n=1 Tax=Nonomuraea sp. NPDC046802 TaxID=3154919 RepID=UPI0033F26AE4